MIYRDYTAIEAVNNGTDIPDAFYHKTRLIGTRKYVATDGWRGYNTITAQPGWKHAGEGTNCGGWDDTPAGTNETEVERDIKALEAKHGDVWVIWTPTSNVFTTGYDALVRDATTEPAKAEQGKTIAHKTKRFELPGGGWRVQYHATDVVTFNPDKQPHYTLNTGGWNTMTTAKRMTEALPGGWYVYRKNWVMYVHTPDGDLELKDGMEV